MKIVEDVRLEVDIPTGPFNRVPNPLDPAYPQGGWGWVTEQPGDSFNYVSSTDTGTYSYMGNRPAELFSELFTIGRKHGVSYFSRASVTLWGGFARAFVDWHDGAGTRIAWTQFAQHGGSATRTTYESGLMSVPANATQARIRVQVFGSSSYNTNPTSAGTMSVSKVSFAGGTSVPAGGFLHKHTWVNIIGPATEIKINREQLNVGTLSAVVKDANLDPASTGAIRQGKAVRVLARHEGTWKPLFTGRIDKASTVYARNGEPTISLTALDNMQRLANTTRPQGVSVATHLTAVLEGCGVPWNIMGIQTGHTAQTSVATSFNENSSASDQVALLRDSMHAYAWVDPEGILRFNRIPTETIISQSGELISNRTFSTNLTGWTSVGTLTRVPAAGSDPTYARVAYTGNTSLNSMLLSSTPVSIATYDVIEVKAWVRGPLGYSARVGLMWDENWERFETSEFSKVDDLGWTEVSWKFNRPHGAQKAQMYVEMPLDASGQALQVDEVSVKAYSLTKVTESEYSDLDVDFNSDECINSVIVNQLVYNGSDNTTEEATFGPYENLASIEEWGRRQTTATVSVGNPEEWARVVLESNSKPTIRINSVTVPVKQVNALTLIDLCSVVRAEYAPKGIGQAQLVSSIEHRITPSGWTMEIGFKSPDSVAMPQDQPVLNTGTAYLTPYGRRTRNAAQTVGTNVWTTVALNVPLDLTGGLEWDDTLNGFVVKKDGLYVINGGVLWAPSTGGNRRAAGIWVNNVVIAECVVARTIGAQSSVPTVGTTVRLVSGDLVQLKGFHDAGTNLDVLASTGLQTRLDMALIGP